MSSYDSIPSDLRNTIDNLPGVNDILKKSFAELWRILLQIAQGDVEQAKPQFEAFLNQLPSQNMLDSVDAEIARLEDDFMIGGRKGKSRKNKKSSKKRRSRKNKKSSKKRRR